MINVRYDLKAMRNPRHKRLAKEHMALAELCARSDVISYEVLGEPDPVPSAYLIHYKLKSIVEIDVDLNPVYGHEHTVQITLTNNYPVEPALCYAKTNIWHPNIKSEGKHKGRICSNTKDFGKLFSLDMLAIRIGEMLQYKNYLALNIPPYPEDETVARWVREYAEPNNIVNDDAGIATDNSILIKPIFDPVEVPDPVAPELPLPPEDNKPSGGIRIKQSKPADTGHIKFKKKDSHT